MLEDISTLSENSWAYELEDQAENLFPDTMTNLETT